MLKPIKKPQSCLTEGFLPLLRFSSHCPPHFPKHNVCNLEGKPSKTKSPDGVPNSTLQKGLILWVHPPSEARESQKGKSLDENLWEAVKLSLNECCKLQVVGEKLLVIQHCLEQHQH